MKRTLIAAAWVAGSTIPLLLATVLVFGCCVLPFHRVIHHVMPVCHMAVELMRGGHHDDSAQTPAPARAKQEPVKRVMSEQPSSFALAKTRDPVHLTAPASAIAFRSFIAHGATRCDQDVGLHVFVETFLI